MGDWCGSARSRHCRSRQLGGDGSARVSTGRFSEPRTDGGRLRPLDRSLRDGRSLCSPFDSSNTISLFRLSPAQCNLRHEQSSNHPTLFSWDETGRTYGILVVPPFLEYVTARTSCRVAALQQPGPSCCVAPRLLPCRCSCRPGRPWP